MMKGMSVTANCRSRLAIPLIMAFLLLAATGFAQEKADGSLSLERQTTEGAVIGVEDVANGTISWKGIPYAKPPIGELRWMAPQSPRKRSTPIKAANYCDICPQYIDHDNNPATPQVIRGNEDCLYLNIWRPGTATADLPVLVWIHGGGNSIQWPLINKSDGSVIASRANMVVVTLNYRLGPLGFLTHPALRNGKKGDDGGASGNYAILDLIRALSWVRENIKTFGGDPRKVTIVGESAGGQNVFSLLSSPLAKGLFHRAISESGVVRFTKPEIGVDHANSLIVKLFVADGTAPDEKAASMKAKATSRKDIAKYLRAKKASDILALYPEGPKSGMIRFPNTFADGKVLPADFYTALKSGKYNKVPLILGTNKEEAKTFLMYDPPFSSWRQDKSLFADPQKTELYDLVARYQSDGWKVMAVDQLARILRDNEDQPKVFAYQFLWGAGGAKASVMPSPFNVLIGAGHAMEIDFVFGTENASLGRFAFDDRNRPGRIALSRAMIDYWAQFARTGNPNREGSGLPIWTAWSNTEGGPKIILLDADYSILKILMSSKELTLGEIEMALKGEPRVKEIQPFWDNSRFRPVNR
ncbi:MAG: carboxylesterase family protein [Syntrophales bacterium]|nr:carboxylesterase family protein [Syntrophales bacterium]